MTSPQKQQVRAEEIRSRADARLRDRFRGCLIGGAVGDALGAPVEFLSRAQILQRFGEPGIRDFVPAYGVVGAITDDTQMTLFTAEGVMRAHVRACLKGICSPPGVIAYAYLRWLRTQGVVRQIHDRCLDGWLIAVDALHARRAPGNTCLSALQELKSAGDRAGNDSKGCGGVMRVAPIGMWAALQNAEAGDDGTLLETFELAVEAAAITHGHPTGTLSAGLFAVIVAQLLRGEALMPAISRGLRLLESHDNHQETTQAVEQACQLAASRPNDPDALALLGKGWIAEEALAIGLYAALSAPNFELALVLSVNHDGDSDSTGSIAGNLLGAMQGMSVIPDRWVRQLELRDVIEQVADDLASMSHWRLGEDAAAEGEYHWNRYPGW